MKFAAALTLAAVSNATETDQEMKIVEEYAADNSVVLWQHGYRLKEWIQIFYDEPHIDQYVKKHINWDNQVTSLSVGEGIKATFCDEPKCINENQDNKSFTVTGPKTLKGVPHGWNDRISHVRIEKDHGDEGAAAPANPIVYVYNGANCSGTKLPFNKNQGTFGDFYNRGFNDRTAGIEVPAGVTVDLWQHGNYSGWKKTYKGPVKDCNTPRDGSSMKIHVSQTKPHGGFSLETNFHTLNYKW